MLFGIAIVRYVRAIVFKLIDAVVQMVVFTSGVFQL
jgi:hypothetical protein